MFSEYLRHGLYLKGWSPKTVIVYKRAYASFQSQRGRESEVVAGIPSDDSGQLTKAQLEAWVVWMRQRGRTAAGCNIYIRAMNAYCSWLRQEGHIAEPIVLKQLRTQTKTITVISEAEIKIILANKPTRLSYQRTWVLIVLLLDTGCRIDEVLKLKRDAVDLDNLLLTVDGKGGKQRRVPFSPECRKHLFRYLAKVPGSYVFGTRNGTALSYRNAYRNIKLCLESMGITGQHIHPHTTRHTFSCNFIKKGGNIFVLSRILGHSSVSVTQTYLRGLQAEELTHLSPLAAS